MWCFDEHRLGLLPIIRRVWTKKGTVAEALIFPRYQWFYLYAFLHPASGRSYWLILPRVDVGVFNLALAYFANHFVEFGKREALLVHDRAGWHMSSKVKWPDGVHQVALPPYSPELQPAERLWQLSDEPFVNRSCETIGEMEDIASERCRQLMTMTEEVRNLTLYRWWPPDRQINVQQSNPT